MAKPDWQIVKEVLDATEGQSNDERAKAVMKKIGIRIRQRARDREDLKRD
jgi:hypothetical protein